MRFKLFMVENIETTVFFVRRFVLRWIPTLDRNLMLPSSRKEKTPKNWAKGSNEVVVSHTIRP